MMVDRIKIRRGSIWLVAGCLLTLQFMGAAPAAAEGEGRGRPKPFELHILHFNDAESQLINAGAGIEDFGGVARFTTVARILRWQAYFRNFQRRAPVTADSILISSGDNFLAGPEFNASLVKGVPYYDSIALSLLNVDAFAFGNHEFDFGPDVTEEFIQGFFGKQVFLSANLDFSGEPGLQDLVERGIIRKSVVLEKAGRKIGIIGAQTPDLPTITSTRNIVVNELLPAIQDEVQNVLNQGANIVILTSHLQGINEDQELIPMLRGVDIVIAGGGDEILADDQTRLVPGDEGDIFDDYPLSVFDKDGIPVPIVTTPGDLKYVGRLIARFDRDGNLIDIDPQSGLVRVAGGDQPDAVRENILQKLLVVTPVERSVESLADNLIATSEVPLEGSRPAIRVEETNLGNLCADSLLFTAKNLASEFGVPEPDVAMQNGGGIRNNNLIPAGDISELTTFDILPFSNFVSVFPAIPRDQFKEILENAVSRIEDVSGRFAHVAGMSFSFDLSGTPQELNDNNEVIVAGTRVVDVTLDDGTEIVVDGVVQPGANITVATIDFLARGGDQYPFRDAEFTVLGVSYQQALFDYITFPAAEGGLAGLISAADYPVGGEGRITDVTP